MTKKLKNMRSKNNAHNTAINHDIKKEMEQMSNR